MVKFQFFEKKSTLKNPEHSITRFHQTPNEEIGRKNCNFTPNHLLWKKFECDLKQKRLFSVRENAYHALNSRRREEQKKSSCLCSSSYPLISRKQHPIDTKHNNI